MKICIEMSKDRDSIEKIKGIIGIRCWRKDTVGDEGYRRKVLATPLDCLFVCVCTMEMT